MTEVLFDNIRAGVQDECAQEVVSHPLSDRKARKRGVPVSTPLSIETDA
jgi:hypothetical protein